MMHKKLINIGRTLVLYIAVSLLMITFVPFILDDDPLNFSNEATLSSNINNKYAFLLFGLPHSGTTFMQQLLTDVLLVRSSTFILFEPDHRTAMGCYKTNLPDKCLYGDNLPKYNQTIRASMLYDLFQCDFSGYHTLGWHTEANLIANIDLSLKEKQEYTGHRYLSMSASHWDLREFQLTQRCKSSQYLVYKLIDEESNDQSYSFINVLDSLMYRNVENKLNNIDLKILILLRRPIEHIPSLIKFHWFLKQPLDEQIKLHYNATNTYKKKIYRNDETFKILLPKVTNDICKIQYRNLKKLDSDTSNLRYIKSIKKLGLGKIGNGTNREQYYLDKVWKMCIALFGTRNMCSDIYDTEIYQKRLHDIEWWGFSMYDQNVIKPIIYSNNISNKCYQMDEYYESHARESNISVM